MTSTSKTSTQLKIAIQAAGGMRAMGRKIGISYQTIQYWLEKDEVPSQWLAAVYRASNGKVPPHKLRPDLYKEYTYTKELEVA